MDMLWCQGAQNIRLYNHKPMRAKVDRMITTHACPEQTDGQTNIMTIAPRFVITNASRAKNFGMAPRGP